MEIQASQAILERERRRLAAAEEVAGFSGGALLRLSVRFRWPLPATTFVKEGREMRAHKFPPISIPLLLAEDKAHALFSLLRQK